VVSGGERFAEKTDVAVIGEGVFVEHRFGSGLNGVLDRVKICRFLEDRIFDDSGRARYRTDTDVLNGLDAFPL